MRSHGVARWHSLLRATAVLNAGLWPVAAVAVTRQHALPGIGAEATAYMQLLLSAVYVAGCAYRSFLPVIDIPRIVLIGSRLSSVLVGRSVATVAELCFAAQWALMLHHFALLGGSALVQAVSLAVLPLIVLAEGFSWYAVLTTEQRAHAVENSLWGLSAVLAVAAVLLLGPHRLTNLYAPIVLGGAAYAAFIFVYDVPMYWSRWRVDQSTGRKYLRIAEGIIDVRRRWTVSYRWEDWRTEIPWMSLYFTFGVWSSIWLAYASVTL